MDTEQKKWRMVQEHVRARGVRDSRVLEAMTAVKRELFVPAGIQEHAYEDRPLPIGHQQTISQPYIVAFMAEALQLKPQDRVLEIGSGCGYAAAVMAEIVDKVYTVERLEPLAQMAADNLARADCHNVNVMHGDGTQGWQDESPFDAILVSAGGPDVPGSLQQQLKVGGRMVIPIGTDPRAQELVRITRISETRFDREDLADVRFVPLIGAEGWEADSSDASPTRVIQSRPRTSASLPKTLHDTGVIFDDIDNANLDGLMESIGDARIVLIGEASHGTSEFYRMRAAITKRLITDKGFNVVTAEADWPDASRIDHYVRHRETPASEWLAFARFPTWMWRNTETQDFVDWLHDHNASLSYASRTGFYGLDLYSMYASVRAVLEYLDQRDPALANIARVRYGCLSPWEADPAAYGRAAITGQYRECEHDVVQVLLELMRKRIEFSNSESVQTNERITHSQQGDEHYLDAVQNAQVVANAETYYRTMYYGSRSSWNLRDSHMFDTLKTVMGFRGEGCKAVVWAHNSHVGDARHTEMSLRGEHNIGQLCAQKFPNTSYRIGFGTDRGTVAASSDWESPMEIKHVSPSHKQSHEYQFHLSEAPGLILPLRGANPQLREDLNERRLERAIGVIYRPETEVASHYFEAELANQFDAYIWIDQTRAITPIETRTLQGLPDTYPFGV